MRKGKIDMRKRKNGTINFVFQRKKLGGVRKGGLSYHLFFYGKGKRTCISMKRYFLREKREGRADITHFLLGGRKGKENRLFVFAERREGGLP